MLHSVLARQLRRLGLSPDQAPDSELWRAFLERVNSYYGDIDQDRYTLERSMALSSEEMHQLHKELQETLVRLNQQSLTDPLTGLHNRRFLDRSILTEISDVLRTYAGLARGMQDRVTSNIDLVFFMVDLDRFKRVNDTFGHAAGDAVLQQVAALLGDAARKSDILVRWGGEEFLAVARNTCRNDVAVVAERFRRAVAGHPFDIGRGEPISCTCSIGIAAFPFLTSHPDALSWERVVGLADRCLYVAKSSGRDNWVGVLAGDALVPEDLGGDPEERLEGLVLEEKVQLITNLAPGTPVIWPS